MLNLIAATQAEADPVISALKLKKITAPLNCYQNKDTHLVIAGIGKCCTATACGWLAEKTAPSSGRTGTGKSAAWLNFGIAGRGSTDTGTLMMAHEVTDAATGRVWYPHRIFQSMPSSSLTTVDRPLAHYPPGQLLDMEASAFVESARHFSHAELVQSVKVVSDNEKQPYTNINAKLANQLITDNTKSILECAQTLQALAASIAPMDSSISDTILEQWHFSVSQTVRLERLLQRYGVIYSPMTDIPPGLQEQKSTKDALNWLQSAVDSNKSYL